MNKLSLSKIEKINGGGDYTNRQCTIAGAVALGGALFAWTGVGAGVAAAAVLYANSGGCFND